MIRTDVAIIGAGIAGFTAAATIASEFPGTRTLLINGEDRAPYKRTKISKNIASGFEKDQFQLESADWYRRNTGGMLSDVEVSQIDPEKKRLELANGETVSWRRLILATGAEARLPALSGIEDVRYFTVRSAADVEALMAAAKKAASIMVVGTGVLGVEVAEQLCRSGKKVIFSGCTNGIMMNELTKYAQKQLIAVFESNGPELLLGQKVVGAGRIDSSRIGVTTTDFTREVDMLVYCIGSVPRTRLAASAGIEVKQGILVDEFLESSVTDIFAAGDAAQHPGEEMTHLWHAAELQGAYAARNAARTKGGKKAAYPQTRFRLKCEVFDRYFFSLLPRGVRSEDALTKRLEFRDSRYICLFLAGDSVDGVIMIDDKDNAKRYETAVRERWSIQRVEKELIGDAKLMPR